jgi:hypothetical protein
MEESGPSSLAGQPNVSRMPLDEQAPGRARGPLSPPTITQSMPERSSCPMGPINGSMDRKSLMRDYLRRRYGTGRGPAHVWCGVSVEDASKLSRCDTGL